MPVIRRSWLFVPGADPQAHRAAARSGADVIVLELEDFTPPALRGRARRLSKEAFSLWRRHGALAAVRINPFETCGAADLAGIARPDIVMMSKVDSPAQVRRLEVAAPRGVALVPNIESALALTRIAAIARASARTIALLVGAKTWWPISAPSGAALARSSRTCARASSSNAAPLASKRSTVRTLTAT